MSRVWVSGAGGFIGSHLCEALVKSGAQVRAFVRYQSGGTAGWLDRSEVQGDVEICKGDLRDFDSVYRSMEGCEKVFHLGALIGIPYSYDSPLAYVKTNVEGTYNVLEAARCLEVDRVIVTSTSEVYGSALKTPIDESHPLQPQSPYSASKIGADNLALSYFYSFKLPVTVARPFNTFGPRQSARAVIPTILSQLLSGAKEVRLGSVTPKRDLTFVSDTVDGMIEMSKADALLGKSVNLGTGENHSIQEVFEILSRITDSKASLVTDDARIRPEASEVMNLLSDFSLMKKVTGWKPKIGFEEALTETVTWMKSHLDLYRPGVYEK